MTTDGELAVAQRREHERLCVAFCSVVWENRKVRADRLYLAHQRSSARSLEALRKLTSDGLAQLAIADVQRICGFAEKTLREFAKETLRDRVNQQDKSYNRGSGAIVLRGHARIGERVKYRLSGGSVGTIISTTEDFGTEIAVRWDVGSGFRRDVTNNLKCGKRERYDLVYA